MPEPERRGATQSAKQTEVPKERQIPERTTRGGRTGDGRRCEGVSAGTRPNEYGYDKLERLVREEDALRNVRTFSYDHASKSHSSYTSFRCPTVTATITIRSSSILQITR